MIGEKLISAVIVRNQIGFTATLRFTDGLLDRCFASNSRFTMYRLIENYLEKKENE